MTDRFDLQTPGVPPVTHEDERRRARRAVVRRAVDVAEAAQWIDMLGLHPEAGEEP